MQLTRYKTKRLDLVASELEHINAELESLNQLGRLLEADIPSGWPPGEYDRGAQEFFRGKMIEGGEASAGWYGWYAIRSSEDKSKRTVVAAAGFYGPPTETGEVEIGYSVVDAFKNKGYATEIVESLVIIAFSNPDVKRILARATPHNPASQSVLKKAGFNQSALVDEEGNLIFEYIRKTY